MIFTNCTKCDEPIVIGWESGDGYGFYKNVCETCGGVSFVECTSFDGETLSEEAFWAKHPDAIPPTKKPS
jgi:hypothetical protein